jgi:TonB-dependent starch-binding outer membrane protein SusC
MNPMKKVLFVFLCSLFSLGVIAQEITLRGVVTSADDGQPLPGVSVVLKGTTTGTVTDFEGNYQLQVMPDAVIQYSFVGMETQEIPVNGRNQINVALNNIAFDVDEVVVVGYGVQRRALTTGANVNIQGEDIEELNTSSAMEALQGIAAGVSITRNSGAPGAGTRVTIRGLGTIGNSNPLFIVDGVAVGNIDYLNPSDIESIDVLKDAASAAIYGSRAANGVVLVTTVKGSKDRPAQITYDAH